MPQGSECQVPVRQIMQGAAASGEAAQMSSHSILSTGVNCELPSRK